MRIINKKLLTLLGLFIFAISIPLTVYLVKQRQEIRGMAEELQTVPCDGNNDQIKIMAAIATSSGTVRLPGRQCTLTGTINIARDNITLEGQGTSSVLYLADNTNRDVITATIGKNNISVKNLKINGNKIHQSVVERGYGIRFDNISRASIEDVIIQDTFWHGIGIYNWPRTFSPSNPEIVIRRVQITDPRKGGLITMGVTPKIIVENTKVERSGYNGIGIRLQGTSLSLRLANNEVLSPQGNGIEVGCMAEARFNENDTLEILNNRVSGMHDTASPSGIWVLAGTGQCDNVRKYIRDNQVLPNGPGITGRYGDHFGLRGNNGELTGNLSEGSLHDGYAMSSVGFTLSNWTITNNTAKNNGYGGENPGGQGFMIYRIRNSTIAGNTASGNSQDGIRLTEGLDNLVVNDNTVYNNGWVGIALRDTSPREATQGGSLRNTLRNNHVYNNRGIGIQEFALGDYNTISCNNVYGNSKGTPQQQIVKVGPHTVVTPYPCVSLTPTPTPSGCFARNPLNGDCRQFPSPCKIPQNWEVVSSCEGAAIF